MSSTSSSELEGTIVESVDKSFLTSSTRETIPASPNFVTITQTRTISVLDCQPSPVTKSPLMTIALTNMYGRELSLSLGSNANGPSPVGDPSPTTLPNSSPIEYTFPTGWAGRICVGPNLSPNGSKIEGSFTGPPDIDVSYVDGYTVPLVCSSRGTAVSGCNIELFNYAICKDLVDGPVCLNAGRFSGSTPPFFEPCAGSAYTHPFDDNANAASLPSNLVSCCIGTPCKPPSRQPGVSKKGNV